MEIIKKLKRITAAALAALLLAALAGCAGVSAPFDEAELVEAAKHTIGLFSEKDFAGLNALCSGEAAELLTPEILESGYEQILANAGELKEFKRYKAVSRVDRETGVDYAIVLYKVAYDAKTVIYTLTWDGDMDLIGIYVK